MAGMSRRKRVPFAQSAWKTGPFQYVPKTPFDRLIDILLDVPGILEDLDMLRVSAISLEGEKLGQRLLMKCQELEKALEEWEQEMKDSLRTFDYTVVGLALPTPQKDEDFALLHLTNLFWIACATVYSSRDLAKMEYLRVSGDSQAAAFAVGDYAFFNREAQLLDEFRNLDHDRSPTAYVYRIARSTPLYHIPQGGYYAALMSLFPLGFSMRYLVAVESPTVTSPGYMSEERMLLKELFDRPFMNAKVGTFLDNLEQDEGFHHVTRGQDGLTASAERARRWLVRPANETQLHDYVPKRPCYGIDDETQAQ